MPIKIQDFYLRKVYLKVQFFYLFISNNNYKVNLSLNIIDIYINSYKY